MAIFPGTRGFSAQNTRCKHTRLKGDGVPRYTARIYCHARPWRNIDRIWKTACRRVKMRNLPMGRISALASRRKQWHLKRFVSVERVNIISKMSVWKFHAISLWLSQVFPAREKARWRSIRSLPKGRGNMSNHFPRMPGNFCSRCKSPIAMK